MLNTNISDWSVFQVEPIDGNENAFSVDNNDVLTITSNSTNQRNICGILTEITQGDILRFEVDAYATPGSEPSVNVQVGSFGQSYNDLLNQPARSLYKIQDSKWEHCIVTYRVPLSINRSIAVATCGFAKAKTGTVKLRNPKVFLNNTQIPTNSPFTQFIGTGRNYLQFIGDSTISVASGYDALDMDADTNGAKNRILCDCCGTLCNVTFHEALIASKRYHGLPARIKLGSSGGDKIGARVATVDDGILGVLEFWGENNSTEIQGGYMRCVQCDDANTDYAPAHLSLTNGVSGVGIRRGLVIRGDNSYQSVVPGTNNIQRLGMPGAIWNTVYAGSGTVETSDERLKDNISNPSEALMRAWGKVNFKVFQFINAIKEKGEENARIHVGVIAQQVVNAFASEGLDAFRYGLLCYDEWEEETEKNDNGDDVVIIEAGNRYGIRYEEALALECAYQRWRLEQLEERINQLTNSTN